MISNPWLTYDWKGWAVLGEMASVWLLLHPVSVCVCVRGCFCVHLLACALCRGCWAGGDGTGGKEVSHWAEIKETPPTFYLAIFKSSTCKKKKSKKSNSNVLTKSGRTWSTQDVGSGVWLLSARIQTELGFLGIELWGSRAGTEMSISEDIFMWVTWHSLLLTATEKKY